MNKKLLLAVSVLSMLSTGVMATNIDTNSSGIHFVGEDNNVTDSTYVNVIGHMNTIKNGFDNNVIGFRNNVDGRHNIVLGTQSTAQGYDSITIGDNAGAIASKPEDAWDKATGRGAVAIGKFGRADGEYTTALGYMSESDGEYNVAIGAHSIAYKENFHKADTKYAGVTNAKGVFSIANGSGYSPMRYMANSPVGANQYEDSEEINSIANIGEFTRQLQGVAAGEISATSTDAVNGSQLYTEIKEVREQFKIPMDWLENHENRIQDLEHKTFDIGKNVLNQANHYTDTQVNKGVAKASALAGLKYLDYNPKDKWSFAASVGHYRNANAVAVGAAYQPNENTMVHGGITVDGEVAYNLGVSFKTGGQKYINKYELAEQVRQLQSDNAELRQELNELRSLIGK